MTADVHELHPSQQGTINPADIRWRVGQISKKDAHKGSLLGYIDARTCMEALDRLDPNWSAEHGEPIIVGGELVGVPCKVTVNGVTRSDVGMPSSQEPIKGAYSDALKRTAVHFGIGRELYELPRIYVKLDDYKKPVAIPTYRNGRWTLPSGAGSVFYDREPDEQPQDGEREALAGRRGARHRATTRPAVPRTPEEQELLDRLLALPGMTHARQELLADAVHVAKGTRANADQLREMLRIATTPIDSPASPATSAVPADAPAPAAGQGDAGGSVPASPDNAESGGRTADSATPPVQDQAASPPGSPESVAAPSDAEILAAAGEGAIIVPPKPGTKAYRDLPSGTERAQAKAYWDAHKAEPVQESLAEALGAPEPDR